jgi:hypothetical protein
MKQIALVGGAFLLGLALAGGKFFFPLLLLLGVGLFLFWKQRPGHPGGWGGRHDRGPGGNVPGFFEEWHRQAHAAERAPVATPAAPVRPEPAAPGGETRPEGGTETRVV